MNSSLSHSSIFNFGLAGGLAWAIGLALRAFLISETPFFGMWEGSGSDSSLVLWIGKSASALKGENS